MALPSFSYSPGRRSLTHWPQMAGQTEPEPTADEAELLYVSDHTQPSGTPQAREGNQNARAPRTSVEAARHAVLRRLAPALKHDMVVNLQAVSMMAETLNARLERSGSDGAELQASISKLNRLSREAVLKCLNVSTWIDPGEDDTTNLHDGIRECVQLMAGSFNFRGFALVNESQPNDLEVSRSALRNLLAAALMTLADTCRSPGELLINSEVSGSTGSVTVTFVPEESDSHAFAIDTPSPRVDWSDVMALASAEAVELHRSEGEITMRFSRALPTTPLRMAPV